MAFEKYFNKPLPESELVHTICTAILDHPERLSDKSYYLFLKRAQEGQSLIYDMHIYDCASKMRDFHFSHEYAKPSLLIRPLSKGHYIFMNGHFIYGCYLVTEDGIKADGVFKALQNIEEFKMPSFESLESAFSEITTELHARNTKKP